MQLTCLNQNKENKKVQGETSDKIDFVPDKDCDFNSFSKLGSTIENNFSYLLRVIWNYVKKSCSCAVATSEDPQKPF